MQLLREGNFITKHKDASNASNYNLNGKPTIDTAAIHQGMDVGSSSVLLALSKR